jgi:hypothetical protein
MFVQRIEASKTARGEGVTKLSKRKKQEIAGYEHAAIEPGRKHAENLKKFEKADTIIRIVQHSFGVGGYQPHHGFICPSVYGFAKMSACRLRHERRWTAKDFLKLTA